MTGRRCKARRSDGEPCKAWAIRGTSVCRVHGGSAPHVRAAGRRRVALARFQGPIADLLDEFEDDLDGTHPVEGLLQAVRRTGAMVHVLGVLVGALHPAPFVDGQPVAGLYGPDHLGDGEPHVLVTMYGQWLDRHAKVCKLALDAGVEERQVRLAEQQALAIVQVTSLAVEDLGLADQIPQLRVALGERMRQLQEGRLPLAAKPALAHPNARVTHDLP